MNAAQTRKIVRAVLVPLLFMLSLSGIANAQLPPPARGALGSAVVAATSAQQQTSSNTFNDPTRRVFELLLPSEHLFGDWDGLRPKLEKLGITPRLILVTDLAGNARGGRSQGATAPSSVELSLFFDLEKIAGVKGGSIFASFSNPASTIRQRPNSACGSQSVIPSAWTPKCFAA